MSNWKDYYKDHVVSLEEAVSKVPSHSSVVDGHGLGRSEILYKALLDRADELEDVKIICGWHLGTTDYCDPKYEGIFIPYSMFHSGTVRNAHWEGRAQYIPLSFSQQETYFLKNQPDFLFTQVTPPDENGNVSMGVSVDYTRTALDTAKVVIAQVNKNMPWVNGDTVVPVESIDYFVEADAPVVELKTPDTFKETDLAIAKNVASLIDDGATLQIGVGAIPDQVLKLLENHKHMGVHTELGSPGLMNLIKKGVIDNSMKTLDKGKCVCTIMGGTKEFYAFVDHNPIFEMRRASYVTNPMIIGQQKNMCCVNSAIEVDLQGQVAADMIGPKQYGGVGGQNDFLRGAMMSEGGKSIICMPSTASRGTRSRIVPLLNPGACVSDTRFDTMYIVTEYGIADLFGKTVDERAQELIKIAHPDFREELEKHFYEAIHYVA